MLIYEEDEKRDKSILKKKQVNENAHLMVIFTLHIPRRLAGFSHWEICIALTDIHVSHRIDINCFG